jgi:hypothetical protein
VAPAALRRSARTGGRGADAAERARRRDLRSGVPFFGASRRRQDHCRAAARQSRQLRQGADFGALWRVRLVPRGDGRLEYRRDGDRCGDAYAGRKGPRPAGAPALPPDARSVPSDHLRRGAHALGVVFQCSVEDHRGAATLHHVDPRHHRTGQGAGHHPFALPAARVPTDRVGPDPYPAAGDRGCRGLLPDPLGRGGDCGCRGGIRSRCPVVARPAPRVCRRRGRRRSGGGSPRGAAARGHGRPGRSPRRRPCRRRLGFAAPVAGVGPGSDGSLSGDRAHLAERPVSGHRSGARTAALRDPPRSSAAVGRDPRRGRGGPHARSLGRAGTSGGRDLALEVAAVRLARWPAVQQVEAWLAGTGQVPSAGAGAPPPASAASSGGVPGPTSGTAPSSSSSPRRTRPAAPPDVAPADTASPEPPSEPANAAAALAESAKGDPGVVLATRVFGGDVVAVRRDNQGS